MSMGLQRGAAAIVVGATMFGLLISGCNSGSRSTDPNKQTTTGGGATTPPPGGGTPPPGGATPPPAGGASVSTFRLDPAITRPENIWYIDINSLGNGQVFFVNSVGHGLADQNAGQSNPANLAAIDKIHAAILRRVSTAYLRNPDGTGRSGASAAIVFVGTPPPGTAGQDYSRICLGSRESQCVAGTLGVEILDFGNRGAEAFCELNRLGTFAGRICGQNSVLGRSPRGGPPFDASSDQKYVDGSYVLGQGSAAEDNRFQEIQAVINDWGTAIGNVVAHEIGHSIGLEHDNSGSNIMIGTTNARDLSDPTLPFTQRSLNVIAQNVGVQP